VEKPKNAEGKYVEGTQEVIYVYEKIEEPKPEVEGSVVTKYVDKEGKEIAQRNTTTDKVGKEYTTENKEIPGYKLVEKPKNAEGKYVEGTQEVIYVYEKIEEPKPEVEGSVVTKYVDKEGKEIAQRNTTTDKVGKEYTTENKEIPGYKLVEKPKNAEGKYVEGTQEVIYVYEKIEEPKPEVEGSVVTKYVDKEGKEIAQRNTTTDKVGKEYTTENKEIPGYKLVEKPKNAEGKYVEGTQEVIYVYEKIEEPKPEVEGSVVTKYVDKDGNEIIPGISTTDKVGNDYQTESKDIPGYKLIEKPKNAKGKYVEGSTEVIYVYEKVEEPNAPMDPKDSNNPKEQSKDESLKKEKPILPNTGAKEGSLFWAILCIISGLLLISNRTKKNF
ncbi:MucBP domain-containing protein, partial [Bacillus cereus]|uniref:MucBP domain-containing protein n=8 Tax=Bacillus cereus TaxID=1396 RepID=UPI00366E48D2